MNSTEILALPAGPALDEAVQRAIWGDTLTPADQGTYSTDDAQAIRLLSRLPLFVARVDPPGDRDRPWTAGQLTHGENGTIDYTSLRVSAPTLPLAICKAALLVCGRTAAAKFVPPAPKAPKPKAEKPAALPVTAPTGYRGLKSKRVAADRAAKKGARLAAPAKPAPTPAAPTGPAQPRIFLRRASERPAIPQRREIAIPQPT
jgi:hypothetical protein